MKNLFLFLLGSICLFACENTDNNTRKDPVIDINKEKAFKFDKQVDSLFLNHILEKQDYVKCIELTDSAIKYYPGHHVFHYNRGTYNYEMGNYREAIHSFYHAWELKQDRADAFFSMGMAYDHLNETDSARLCYAKAFDMFVEKSQNNKNDTSAYLDLKINVPALVWLLTRDEDSVRRFIRKDLDSSMFNEGQMELVDMLYEDISQVDSALFPNGRASAVK